MPATIVAHVERSSLTTASIACSAGRFLKKGTPAALHAVSRFRFLRAHLLPSKEKTLNGVRKSSALTVRAFEARGVSSVRDKKLFNPSFVALACMNFLVSLSFYLLMVKFVEFAERVYGVSSGIAGLTISVYVVGALTTRVLLGRRIDFWGVRKSLFVGFGISAVCACLYLVSMSYPLLLLTRFAHGVGFGIGSGAAAAGVAFVVPEERRAEGVGYFSMSQSLATGVGPFVAIILADLLPNYVALFGFSAVMGIVAFLVASCVSLPSAPEPFASCGVEDGIEEKLGECKRIPLFQVRLNSFLQVSVLPVAAIVFMAYLCAAGVLGFLSPYADVLGMGDVSGFYFVAYAASIMVTRPLVGRRADKKGENSVVYSSLSILAIGLIMLGSARCEGMLLASSLLIGFGVGATQSVLQATAIRMTPASQMGKANSTFFISIDLGMGIGPVAFGLLSSLCGYASSYLALAFLAALAVPAYHVLHGRKAAVREVCRQEN